MKKLFAGLFAAVTAVCSTAWVVAATGLELAFPPELYAPGQTHAHKTTLTVLSANVGNSDVLNCGKDYVYKLCVMKVEKKVAESIRAIRPDIMALQEVFDDGRCARMPREKNKARLCHGYDKREPRQQARRLMGGDYTIVCDNRSHFSCLGIRKDVGTVEGCEPGALCLGAGMIAPPAPDMCDEHTAIFAVDAIVGGRKVRIVDAHPAASNTPCRTEQLQSLFASYKGAPALADTTRDTLIMGDMNMNPFGDTDDPSVAVWREYVGDGKPFAYLSGPAEHDPPYPTIAGRTIDHVVSNFAKGRCVTLGRKAALPRLDGTYGKPSPEGTDHCPLVCELDFSGK